MDLLKLHSLTHKLLDRMDRVEKVLHWIPHNSHTTEQIEIKLFMTHLYI